MENFPTRKIIIWLLGFFLLVGVVVFFPKKSTVMQPTAGTTIIAFGDSLVAGYGSEPGKDFVSLLSDNVGQEIINAGVNGDTTQSAKQRLSADVLEKDPKIVMVLLGGNDFLRRVPKTQTLENLREIILQIKGKGAAVILIGFGNGLLGGYESEYKNLAKENQIQYVPNVLSGVFGRNDLMYDAIHPNSEGYKKVAEKILPYLKKVLR